MNNPLDILPARQPREPQALGILIGAFIVLANEDSDIVSAEVLDFAAAGVLHECTRQGLLSQAEAESSWLEEPVDDVLNIRVSAINGSREGWLQVTSAGKADIFAD